MIKISSKWRHFRFSVGAQNLVFKCFIDVLNPDNLYIYFKLLHVTYIYIYIFIHLSIYSLIYPFTYLFFICIFAAVCLFFCTIDL